MRTALLEVGDCRNFRLLEYTKTTKNKKSRINVTAVRTPINTSISTGCEEEDDIPMPEKLTTAFIVIVQYTNKQHVPENPALGVKI